METINDKVAVHSRAQSIHIRVASFTALSSEREPSTNGRRDVDFLASVSYNIIQYCLYRNVKKLIWLHCLIVVRDKILLVIHGY